MWGILALPGAHAQFLFWKILPLGPPLKGEAWFYFQIIVLVRGIKLYTEYKSMNTAQELVSPFRGGLRGRKINPLPPDSREGGPRGRINDSQIKGGVNYYLIHNRSSATTAKLGRGKQY